MKKIFFLLFIMVATNAIAQNKDYIITLEGIGALKLGMSQAELEKLLKKNVSLSNPLDTASGSWMDSAKIKYKNIDVELSFQRQYVTNDSFQMVIAGMKTSSPLCRTKSGIGIGDDKLKIITVYENYNLDIKPVYIDYDKYEKSKTMSTISVKEGSEGYTILFHLVKNKVVAFEIFPDFDDEE